MSQQLSICDQGPALVNRDRKSLAQLIMKNRAEKHDLAEMGTLAIMHRIILMKVPRSALPACLEQMHTTPSSTERYE